MFLDIPVAKSFKSKARGAALISSFCRVQRIRVFDSQWMGHLSITGWLPRDAGTQFTTDRMKAELALEEKKVAQTDPNIGRAWDRTRHLLVGIKAEILPTAPTIHLFI